MPTLTSAGRALHVHLLLPACGYPPPVPAGCEATLQRLYALRFEAPTLREALRDDLRAVPRAIIRRRYQGRHRGLTRFQMRRWCNEIAPNLTAIQQVGLMTYATACVNWYRHLHAITESKRSAWDWSMTPATNAPINGAERQLEAALTQVGLPIEAQVGISPRGGPRRGGWFGNWWLDYAHRDRAYLLKIDIELDGWHHHQADRAERDEQRNMTLQERGWYVFRVPGSVIARRLCSAL